MTQDEYERILQRLQDQVAGLNTLHFTGGEPTLWPHLRWAIDRAKEMKIANRIRVVTNAVDRTIDDYGQADYITVSDYGAQNRLDWLRLKRTGSGRVHVLKTVHLNWPYIEIPENNLPAECGCVQFSFLGDRVWPCGFAVARNAQGSLHIDEPFYSRFVNGHPREQELCRTCLSNRKNKIPHMAPLTFEWSFWESDVGGTLSLRGPGMRIRSLYRKLCGKESSRG